VVEINGVRCGLAICADVWEYGAAEAAAMAGAELMLTLNASPFHMNKQARRYEVLRERVAATGKPVIYANLVGGQDELVFDGASFALDGNGRLTHQLPAFVEDLTVVDYSDGHLLPGRIAEPATAEAEVYSALKMGVADYLGKNGFPGAILGLSGGIDSALTLAIAVDALGADKVRCGDDAFALDCANEPRRFTRDGASPWRAVRRDSDRRRDGAIRRVAGADFCLAGAETDWDTTDENLQARIRGMLLMALVQPYRAHRADYRQQERNGRRLCHALWRHGRWLCGDQGCVQDLRLSPGGLSQQRFPRSFRATSSSRALGRAQARSDRPGHAATLRGARRDHRSLHGARPEPARDHCRGYPEADVRKVVGMLKRNEYKRRQAPVGIRVTQRGFGKDWRYPITSRYPDEY
jgi:NAD+ synthase (glutamine-hydrolysing)